MVNEDVVVTDFLSVAPKPDSQRKDDMFDLNTSFDSWGDFIASHDAEQKIKIYR